MLRTSDAFPTGLAYENVEVLVGINAACIEPIFRVNDLSMKDGQPDRMADICGREIDAILSATGWRYGKHSNSGIGVVMVNGQVAAAFIFSVIRRADGCQGVNLSYFCAPQQDEINLSQGTVQFSGFTASLTHCERVLHHARDVPGVADLFHSTAQLGPSDDEFQCMETPT